MLTVGRVCSAAALISVSLCSQPALADVGPAAINEYDLWGIHDFLIAGFGCPACNAPDLAGAAREKVQQAAVDFATLLREVHPIKKCRDEFKQVISGSNQTLFIDTMAAKSWSCIDPTIQCNASSVSEFCDVENFLGKIQKDPTARPPPFVAKTQESPVAHRASACKSNNTQWSRACSYWVSFHAMGLRADATNTGYKLFQSLVPMIAGGAILCKGCTKHYIAFMQDFLKSDPSLETFVNYSKPPPVGVKVFFPIPCFRPQCHLAIMHSNEIIECMVEEPHETCARHSNEIAHMRAFQQLVKKAVDTGTLPAPLTAILSIHHDLVSEAVPYQAYPKGKSFCSPFQACKLLKQSPIIKADPESMNFDCTAVKQSYDSFKTLWEAPDAKCVAGAPPPTPMWRILGMISLGGFVFFCVLIASKRLLPRTLLPKVKE